MSMKSLSSRSVRAADHASLRTLRARNPGPYILVPSLSSRESARPFTFSTQATASTMGNASPEPSSIASSAPKLAILDVMKQAWGCIVRNFWSMAFIFALCDLLQFGLHRISHRLTNEVSVMLFSGRGVSADAIGTTTRRALFDEFDPRLNVLFDFDDNELCFSPTYHLLSAGNMWWLSNDPTIMNFSTGYQPTSLVFFLLMVKPRSPSNFPHRVPLSPYDSASSPLPLSQPRSPQFPINLLIRSLSFGAAVLALEREAAAPAVPADGTPAPKKKLFAGLREGVGRVWGLRGELAAMAKRIVWVELVVSLQVRGEHVSGTCLATRRGMNLTDLRLYSVLPYSTPLDNTLPGMI